MLIQYSNKYKFKTHETKLLHLGYVWAVVWRKVTVIGEAPCFISKRQ